VNEFITAKAAELRAANISSDRAQARRTIMSEIAVHMRKQNYTWRGHIASIEDVIQGIRANMEQDEHYLIGENETNAEAWASLLPKIQIARNSTEKFRQSTLGLKETLTSWLGHQDDLTAVAKDTQSILQSLTESLERFDFLLARNAATISQYFTELQ
jgi:predicted  nucleic acid-binding Zn-ribbon protein